MSENMFAAIDPTCQRQLTASSSSCSRDDDQQHRQLAASTSSQPVIPADINVAQRRAPLGTFLYTFLALL